MKCIYCNCEFSDGSPNCPRCHIPVAVQTVALQRAAEPPKKRWIYQLLALFLGQLGVHNFYAGRIPIAVVQLATTVILNIIVIFVLHGPGGVGPVIIWAWVEIFAVKRDGRGRMMI